MAQNNSFLDRDDESGFNEFNDAVSQQANVRLLAGDQTSSASGEPLRDRADGPILMLQHTEGFPNGGVRHRGGHIQERAFIQWWHKFPAKAGEALRDGLPETGVLDPLRWNSEFLRRGGNHGEDAVRTQPHRHSRQHHQAHGRQVGGLVIKTPPKNRYVQLLQEHECAQKEGENEDDEAEVFHR